MSTSDKINLAGVIVAALAAIAAFGVWLIPISPQLQTMQPTPSAIIENIQPTPTTSQPTPTTRSTWPIISGVEACHLRIGDIVEVQENARLWTTPNVIQATLGQQLLPASLVEVTDGPEWGKIREDIAYSGWWYEIVIGEDKGWLWEARIEGCSSPDDSQ